MVSATLPGVAFRLERQGHRSSLALLWDNAGGGFLDCLIDFNPQAA